MFHVSSWSATASSSALEMSSIPIWAHLKRVPLDLRSQEGLSFAAGLIGHIVKDCLRTTQAWVSAGQTKQPVNEESNKNVNQENKDIATVFEASTSSTDTPQDNLLVTTVEDFSVEETHVEQATESIVETPAGPSVFHFSAPSIPRLSRWPCSINNHFTSSENYFLDHPVTPRVGTLFIQGVPPNTSL
ncbi:hypothetical protein Rs2_42278 [Raphanus sativus]|nr:hypothetical protein Rs2_42278 [Raphanus sativus]